MTLFRKKHNYDLLQVEETLRLKTWWAAVFILPMARRVSLFLANYTDISPNTVTAGAFFLRLVSAALFASGGTSCLIAGALLFEAAYMLDCVDGSIARLKEKFSAMGAFFDHVTDTLGVVLNLIALAYGRGILFDPHVFYVVALYLFVHYLTFVANNILLSEKFRIGSEKDETLLEDNVLEADKKGLLYTFSRMINAYRNVFARHRFKAFMSPPDFEALVLFIFPLAGKIRAGFVAGYYFLIVLFVYKIFSYLYVIKLKSTVSDGFEE